MVVGTVHRNADAFVGGRADRKTGSQTETVSAVVECQTAVRSFNARLALDTPGRADFAHAVAAVVVVFGAFFGNCGASVGDGTPGPAAQQTEAVSTVVVELTTFRHRNALLADGTEGGSGMTDFLANAAVATGCVSFLAVAALQRISGASQRMVGVAVVNGL